MTIFRRTYSAPEQLPPAVQPVSLAGLAALGRDGGSGRVEPWNALQPSYGSEADVSEDIGQHVLVTANPALVQLPPDSLYVSRQLHGGVRTSAARYGFPWLRMSGGHSVMTNRPPLVLVEGEQMSSPAWVSPTEWRITPPVVELCRRGPENVPSGLSATIGVG